MTKSTVPPGLENLTALLRRLIRILSTCSVSIMTYSSSQSLVLALYERPASAAFCPMIEFTSSMTRVSLTAVLTETTLPALMRLVSRTSSIRPSRYRPDDWIFSRFSLSCGVSSLSCRLSCTSPMIAVMGVRMSWLIWDRNASFSLPVFTATRSALAISSICCRSLTCLVVSINVRTRPCISCSPSRTTSLR